MIKYMLLFLAAIIHIELAAQKGNSKYIEGLFYFDQSPVRIEITNGKITNILRIKELSEKKGRIYIAPGFIDNQVNGYNSVSFVEDSLTVKDIEKATRGLWQAGVTTYLPTVTTTDQRLLVKNLSILQKAKNDARLHGSIAGFHLEGPYLSPEDGYRGSHPLKFVRKPDWNEFMEMYEASGRNILQITLAPEIEGAMDFISKCREKNIVVAIGHHNASANQVTEALDRGAQIVTHLGNGLANSINRHVNPLWSQLSDDRLMISIIGDGFHLLPEEIRVFYKVKGAGKTIITSDVTHYAGMLPGKYSTPEGDMIELTPEGALLNLTQHVLFGSASPITKGVGHVMKVTGCTLAEAVQMSSTNPAHLYGLTDRGEIKNGMRADLILFTIEDFKIQIKETIVAGEVVYESVK